MCVCVCDFLTLLDGLRGSSARLSSKYRTDQRCFRTLCQNRKRNISRTSSQSDNAMPEKYPTLTLNVEHNQRMNNMINTAPSVHDMLHTNKQTRTCVWSFLCSSENRAASASLLCFSTATAERQNYTSSKSNNSFNRWADTEVGKLPTGYVTWRKKRLSSKRAYLPIWDLKLQSKRRRKMRSMRSICAERSRQGADDTARSVPAAQRNPVITLWIDKDRKKKDLWCFHSWDFHTFDLFNCHVLKSFSDLKSCRNPRLHLEGEKTKGSECRCWWLRLSLFLSVFLEYIFFRAFHSGAKVVPE